MFRSKGIFLKRFSGALLLAPLLLAACGTAGRLDGIRSDYSRGDFTAVEKKTEGKKDSLNLLLGADAKFQNDKFAESDAAFEAVNRGDHSTGILGETARALSSQMATEYRPSMMDNLFVSYYQIWDALAMSRPDNARVIINQSYKKQQDMSREFATLIGKKREKSSLAKKLAGENAQWNAYKDIMNPALTYLAGIYFLNFAKDESDYENARVYFSRAAGMAPDAGFIKKDLAAAQNRRTPNGVAWVFIESGFAPKLVEQRIDWPTYGTSGVYTVSFAVSRPVMFSPMPAADGSALLADVDAMFMTEYGEYTINEALRAFASAAAKGALQVYANDRGGALGGLAATIYSMATTDAEIRTWITLPKHIRAVRIEKKKQGLIQLAAGANIISQLELEPDGNELIYIRFLGREAKPKIIRLNEQ